MAVSVLNATFAKPANQVELTGQFLRERFRFENETGDVIVGDVSYHNAERNRLEVIAIKGPSAMSELREGQSYVFFGKFSSYQNRTTRKTEQQFHFETFVRESPASREAVISYLSQHGEGLGIGKARALKLWETFGSDAVRVAREQPEKIVESLRSHGLSVSEEQANEFRLCLETDSKTEKSKLDLTGLLSGRGFPKAIATLCLQEFGNKAAQIIRRNPYQLMRFKNCGFKRCDSLYTDLGLPLGALKRQALSAWYSLARDTTGSTWYPETYPIAFLRANIAGAEVNIPAALRLATRGKVLTRRDCSIDGKVYYSEYEKAEHESSIARSVVYSRNEELNWPDVASVPDISEHQREKLRDALREPIAILGGSPGTGKTYTVASLVKAIGDQYGYSTIAIGAPTGKAAVRVTENLSARGIDLTARTWHSQLMALESQGHSHFQKKFVIGDESSMNDTDLTAWILRCRAVGTHLLLVGDVNQLPPVGHGAPLRDMITAGVAYGELREIKRNSGGIVETCAAIRDGHRWEPGDNLLLDQRPTPEMQTKAILDWLTKAASAGLDPVWDAQPLVAVNAKSPLGRKELNKVLQQFLNTRPGIQGIPFREGDKLVNTKNGYFRIAGRTDEDAEQNERNEVYVANGELAKVLSIDRTGFVAELQSPYRVIEVRIFGSDKAKTDTIESDGEEETSSTGCTFDLGYALSVHKAQGSDWPWVLPVLDQYPGAMRVCDRSWLYTAISRAKSKCILIGMRETAERMIRSSNVTNRKTFLREKILELSAIEQLAEI